MSIPSNEQILVLLNQLDSHVADDLETSWLEFKPWKSPKDAMREAVSYAACFANAEGGAMVFGVADGTRGRAETIHGAHGYNVDVWRKAIFDGLRPHLAVDIEELSVPEGTGKLLVVRVPKGNAPPYGTAEGLYKVRIGKNCMPMDAHEFAKAQVSSGAVDWSGQPSAIGLDALDPIEIARARGILRGKNPESELLRLDDESFLKGLEAVKGGRMTHTGLLLFGRPDVLADLCPQHQVHYVHQVSDTKVARNDTWRLGLLHILERLEQSFSGPVNPEEEVSVGLFKLRIPAFPLDVVREAVLNAVTHRDYADPGEVLIRHAPQELSITSPGGFVGGITTENVLRHEPVARNRTLANAFLKLRLVESAGTGIRRIFTPMLGYGKRVPQYVSDGSRVTLRLFDGVFDRAMAALVAKWNGEGRTITLDGLLVLSHLKQQAFIDSRVAADLLQLDRESARTILEQLSHPTTGFLERKGHTLSATYHLAKGVAKDLLGKAAYTRVRGLNPTRYAEMVREYLRDHQSVSNREIRELLGLGASASAQVEASKYLKRWSASDGFLEAFGGGNQRRYRLRTGHS